MLKGILLPLSEKKESKQKRIHETLEWRSTFWKQSWNRDAEILMRFSDTLIIDYSVPEPENERGPDLHAETRKAYLVRHRFLPKQRGFQGQEIAFITW